MISSLVRRVATPATVERLRPLNRVRWLAKLHQTRKYGADWLERPAAVARYVLWDPEVGDFSYELANREQFAAGLATALGVTSSDVLACFDEIGTRPELSDDLVARLRSMPGLPSQPGFGPRIGWYAAVRLRRPRLVVETGIKHGFGALLMLSALRANAAEGHPGRLVSIDDNPAAGAVVPSELRAGWTRIQGRSPEALRPVLASELVEMLIHDTFPTREVELAEYELALERRGDRLLLCAGSHGGVTPHLEELAQRIGAPYRLIREVPDHPIYPGEGMSVVIADRP